MMFNATRNWVSVFGIASSIYGSYFPQFPLFQSLTTIDHLHTAVEGRLFLGTPYAKACYEHPTDVVTPECSHIQTTYGNESVFIWLFFRRECPANHWLHSVSRTSHFGAYVQSQWETCQATEEKCLLDWTNPRSWSPFHSRKCHLGSISEHFVSLSFCDDFTQQMLNRAFRSTYGNPATSVLHSNSVETQILRW
jgi:hypothetical protein